VVVAENVIVAEIAIDASGASTALDETWGIGEDIAVEKIHEVEVEVDRNRMRVWQVMISSLMKLKGIL
jgi:hypothetical protein